MGAVRYTVIYALMELEYIIPMGQSVVYYEASGRLEWGARCEIAPVNSTWGLWIIHQCLLESLESLNPDHACDRGWTANDNSWLVHRCARKNGIRFMIIVVWLHHSNSIHIIGRREVSPETITHDESIGSHDELIQLTKTIACIPLCFTPKQVSLATPFVDMFLHYSGHHVHILGTVVYFERLELEPIQPDISIWCR